MRVLGIETSTYAGSVSLVEDFKVINQIENDGTEYHSEWLLPAIEKIVNDAGYGKENIGECIDAVAVSIGPGFFTALRVGIAVAKGISLSLGVPIVGVSSMDVVAQGVCTYTDRVCAVMDAKRGEIFAAFYKFKNCINIENSDIILASPEKIVSGIREKTVFVGNCFDLIDKAVREGERSFIDFAPEETSIARASNCALIGLRKLNAGVGDDVATLAPFYARKTDAEIMKQGVKQ